jgi:hypothetical protein
MHRGNSHVLFHLATLRLTLASMPNSHRFETSAIKNKQKREGVFHKAKKEKRQAKLQRRLANAKREADDPKAKQVCTHTFEPSHTAIS